MLAANEFEQFVKIVRRLRRECPWDREQTHESIRESLLEEAYEVIEAIDQKRWDDLKKELGDLLLHVVFHASIAEQEKKFTLREIIESVSEKLVRRHPHVFGETSVKDAHEVKRNWEAFKLTEGRTSLMDGVPKELPALLRAFRLQDKASKMGFDWKDKDEVWNKVEEEKNELRRAVEEGSQENKEILEEELGDMLFALVNYARFVGVNPERALRVSVEKFIERFQYIERRLREQGKDIRRSNLEEMDGLWEEAKRRGR